MEKKKEPVKISIYTQKGGVGKSTITTLLASVLHYRLGYNVLVVDCDFPQHSLINMRERDKKSVMESEYHKRAVMKQFQWINKKAYPVIKSTAENALDDAFAYSKKNSVESDIIFFDLPGTVNTEGVLTVLKAIDYIFSPISADRVVVESTLVFSEAFLKLPAQDSNRKGPSLFLFWNQVDGREKSSLYDAYGTAINKLSLSLMQARVMDSKRFRKELDDTTNYVFRSSLLPADPALLKATRLDVFIKEFVKIIKV